MGKLITVGGVIYENTKQWSYGCSECDLSPTTCDRPCSWACILKRVGFPVPRTKDYCCKESGKIDYEGYYNAMKEWEKKSNDRK